MVVRERFHGAGAEDWTGDVRLFHAVRRPYSDAVLPQMKTAVRGSLLAHRRESSCEIDLHGRAYAASRTISSFEDWATAAGLDDAGILVDFIAACAVTIPYSIAG